MMGLLIVSESSIHISARIFSESFKMYFICQTKGQNFRDHLVFAAATESGLPLDTTLNEQVTIVQNDSSHD